MAFCPNCSYKLEENANFCPNCGAHVNEPTKNESASYSSAAEAYDFAEEINPAPAPKKASGELNIGMLVWSIINMLCCCTPLGIASLVCTILAKDAPSAEEEAKKLKAAKICNLIADIVFVLYVVLYVVLVVAGVLSESLYYYI